MFFKNVSVAVYFIIMSRLDVVSVIHNDAIYCMLVYFHELKNAYSYDK